MDSIRPFCDISQSANLSFQLFHREGLVIGKLARCIEVDTNRLAARPVTLKVRIGATTTTALTK